MSKSPRYYQREAVSSVFDYWDRAEAHPMVVMATGTGKTYTAGVALREALEAEPDARILWLAHREELLNQAIEDVCAAIPGLSKRAGVVQANRDDHHKQFVAASVFTLKSDNRIADYLAHGYPAIVVVDECHHSPSPTYVSVLEAVCQPGTRLMGLTATPDREDGADLGDQWEIAYFYGIDQAVAEGHLAAPYAAVRAVDIDMEEIEDLDDEEMGAELIRQGIVDATVAAILEAHKAKAVFSDDTWEVSAATLPGLVFTASVEQSRLTAEALTAAGIESRYICGTTPKSDRKRILKAFKAGKIQYICNPSVLTEGTNLPRARVAVLARPLRSWSLFVQCCGRVLRLHPLTAGGFLLDLGGSTLIHDLVAAPVLIGGSKCPESPQGVHNFVACPTPPKGECTECGRKVACFTLLGPHDFDLDTHKCKACGAPQCPDSADSRHHWIPVGGVKRVCIDCGTEVTDPHAGMLSLSNPADIAKAEWIRVPNVSPESWVVDAGESGQLYVIGCRKDELWDVFWLPKRARNPRPVSPGKVPSARVRGWADNIARRAKVFRGDGAATHKQLAYAESLGVSVYQGMSTAEASREIARHKARARILKLGLADVA